MPIYMPIYTLLSTFVFDVAKVFYRTTILQDSLIKLTWKIWFSTDKITNTHRKVCQICHREKLAQKIVEILLNQAENSFNRQKLWLHVFFNIFYLSLDDNYSSQTGKAFQFIKRQFKPEMTLNPSKTFSSI